LLKVVSINPAEEVGVFSFKGRNKQWVCAMARTTNAVLASITGMNCCHLRACVLNPSKTTSLTTVS